MLKNLLLSRLILTGILLGVVLVTSACYKDAGEDAAPTSNVSRNDLATSNVKTSTPTLSSNPNLSPTPANPVLSTPTTAPAVVSPTGLRPTITPADESGPQIQPSFTSAPTSTVTPNLPAPVTPGLSDIQPTITQLSTRDASSPLQATPTNMASESSPCLYMIQPNDTLYSIARENEVSTDDIIAVNPSIFAAGEATILQIGWQIQLPGCGTPTPTGTVPAGTTPVPGTETTHTVQSGETIYSIARQYGVDPDAIIAANGITNPSLIYPGQTLIIPAP
ncbi:MAG TPA: LysM peptidoglycan-binding domain-containing protein [Aggregatilineaceae bacterium]|nr:LysM peptidoglycan-binding domain-containing protein [Aggregatilineaceae bacterium]